ncbi:hypothetical protein, partial [Aeromonas caviae]|uniref:hypothetical protein n=1 Tax=Aeromonas caviae TaxID=648 RepID=UPI002B4742B9
TARHPIQETPLTRAGFFIVFSTALPRMLFVVHVRLLPVPEKVVPALAALNPHVGSLRFHHF